MAHKNSVKSIVFPHCNNHKYTWISPDGETYNQTDHALTNKKRHSIMFDVQYLDQLTMIQTISWWFRKLETDCT
jgi:hypothetical protein